MRRHATQQRRPRAGIALVAALGLMLLAAGLLAGTAVASLGLQRASRTLAATGRAESELRRGLALVLQGWDVALDSMPIGAVVDRVAVSAVTDGAPFTVRTRMRRLGPALYAASVAVQVGDSAAPLASRRARLLLGRAVDSATSGALAGVRPLARWSLTDLP
jgi:hypothetical protein